jgi:digeranylgeranylglycerophospholipid reductase
MKFDVLVLGASSAGLAAAISAARSGAEVVLVDRDLGQDIHHASTLFEGMASRAGLRLESSFIKKTLQGMRIVSPSGYSLTIPTKGYFLDRKRFDDHYLKIAEDQGVVLLKDEASSTELSGSKRSIKTSKYTLTKGVVVDASGVYSSFGCEVGIVPMTYPADIAWAMEVDIQHPGLGEEEHFEYFVGSISPGWKATFSPAGGDRATLGVFVRGHGRSLRPFLNAFIKRFAKHKAGTYPNLNRPDCFKITATRRGGDPIATLPGELVADAFMVTGGAAGQSGLAYSMRAGTICGKVAAESAVSGDTSKEALSRYTRLWRSEFYWEYRMARASLITLRKMSDSSIDELMKKLSGKNLLCEGPLYKKSMLAGLKVALASPSAAASMAYNLWRKE